ncbi:MAG: SDR family NAD(P)-dependent oxidoreductase [Porticoccaceae bacterium]
MRAAIIGAGGIGAALAEALLQRTELQKLYCFSRTAKPWPDTRVEVAALDIGDEASIANAAAQVDQPLDLVIIATGTLHGNQGDVTYKPEKALSQLNSEAMSALFSVNTVGPALVLRYFANKMRRDSSTVMAALSARVGSIGDNRLGGWYSYRASKAALNMVIKCASIELARRAPQLQVIGLHPGTVDTSLSQPFQGGVAPEKLFTPTRSANALLDVIDSVIGDKEQKYNGRCLAWDGSVIPE